MPNKTLKRLFNFASQEKAEKLIISNNNNDLTCHYQLPYGEEAVFNLPKKLETSLTANLRQLLKLAPEELTVGKYCKLRDKDYNLNFYLSILPNKNGEKIIISLVHEKNKITSLKQLGIQPADKKALQQALNSKGGLIVISSEPRNGKTTTLFSCLKELDKEKRNIYFLGQYPELELDGVQYLLANKKNWEKVLQHDSEVIVAEFENESPDLIWAIKAANTGRLVIITIQASSSLEALFQLLTKYDIPCKMILDNLAIITSQKLIDLKRQANKKDSRAQIGIFEIFLANKQIKEFIFQNQNRLKEKLLWQEIMQLSSEYGYQPMINDFKKKKKENLI